MKNGAAGAASIVSWMFVTRCGLSAVELWGSLVESVLVSKGSIAKPLRAGILVGIFDLLFLRRTRKSSPLIKNEVTTIPLTTPPAIAPLFTVCFPPTFVPFATIVGDSLTGTLFDSGIKARFKDALLGLTDQPVTQT